MNGRLGFSMAALVLAALPAQATATLPGPAVAAAPSAPDVVVLRTLPDGEMPIALVRDRAMRRAGTYFVAVGAHFGGAWVVAIRKDGIVLSTGTVLPLQRSLARAPPPP